MEPCDGSFDSTYCPNDICNRCNGRAKDHDWYDDIFN